MRVRGHHRHLDRRPGRIGGRHLLALAGITLVAASTAVGLGLIQTPNVQVVAPAIAPDWRTGAVLCRHDPMAYVPHPTRFLVLSSCSTVSGIVRQVRRDPTDGELNMLVEVDQDYTRFLSSDNSGVLRAAAVPRDVPRMTVPRVGQHATLYGSWVLDRNQRNQAALHPVWKIKVSSDAAGAGVVPDPASARGSGTAAAKRLWVDMRVPHSVPVGGAIEVSVRVESGAKGARRPLSKAHLFFEIHNQDDRGVQWKAATTNALGLARVTLVALERPGSFRLWLYADKTGRSAVVSAPVTVRRR